MINNSDELRAIPARMCAAWDRGDAAGFFADFAEDADFVEFEGTVHHGRDTLIAVHAPIFDTVLKGSRLVRGDVPFTRVVAPGVAVVHHRAWMLMPGETEPLGSRQVMQMLTVAERDGRWQVVALQNARVVSFQAAGALDALSAQA
ncbi:SgcJ/EcaC family oxidoreductase [Actinoplanes couchii]|uniref:SnoaL-like domain-containing protein n=1 Tax=Actinoplanes couchii TaxID=403638 RepID=A0ABQ3XTU2_9ACTN|nr:SgcJ/EcaC family oxidoreductase [Actinoplanes couchii]MDR6319016.1 uncharacterized protein (TIGR02246 family) [Actinoplanes couchii]GID61915.1 hypothetical protein Aco03nite_103190 [Actinoplanes couchii]